MFRIGEFSKLTRVSSRMLRYYDQCGLFHPTKIDEVTGYRLYSANQIPLLNKIITLRDSGFQVEEITEVLERTNDIKFMEAILNQKLNQTNETIFMEQQKIIILKNMLNNLKEENYNMEVKVEVKEIKSIKVLSYREVIEDYSKEDILWEKMNNFIESNNVDVLPSNEIISLYHDDDEKETNVDMEVAIPVAELSENKEGFIYRELEAIPMVAAVRYTGFYDNIGSAMETLAKWIEDNNYQIVGNMRGVGIKHFGNETDPQKFITEIQMPIQKI